MAVAPNGVLYLVGVNDNYATIVVSKSLDAQNPLDPSTSFTTAPVNLGGEIG